MNNDGHFKSFEELYGSNTDESSCPSVQEAKKKLAKTFPFNASQQHVKNVNYFSDRMWRVCNVENYIACIIL